MRILKQKISFSSIYYEIYPMQKNYLPSLVCNVVTIQDTQRR